VAWKTDAALAKSQSKERERDKDKAKRNGKKTNLWFLSGPSLITSAVNIYSFLPQLSHLVPGTVYYNIKTPLTIYETGQIFGFRFPTREEIEAALEYVSLLTSSVNLASPPPLSLFVANPETVGTQLLNL
jgi:hypothetical protein